MNTTRLAFWVGAAALLGGCASTPAPTTVVMSGPPAAPAASGCDAAALRQAMLETLNAVRASGQMCGQAQLAPARPVRWNPQLAQAAGRHSADMAKRDFLGERGSDGSRVQQRARRVGYGGQALGENIAAGDYTPSSVVNTWLGSERHCRTLMNPRVNEVGASCVSDASSDWGTYWTMVLGQRVEKKAAPTAKRAVAPRAKAKAKPKARKVVTTRKAAAPRATAKVRPVAPAATPVTVRPVR